MLSQGDELLLQLLNATLQRGDLHSRHNARPTETLVLIALQKHFSLETATSTLRNVQLKASILTQAAYTIPT